MKFKRNIKNLIKKQNELDSAIGKINGAVLEVSDFDIVLENVGGDGWCFRSDINGFDLYMKMEDVLEVIEKKGVFTIDDWNPFN
ncbi:hypothetical protein [Tenacibaculum ovolyticum]|uniref:hypothetical protein n=1 Tax=Tenacibaculum ovolyticum TaxID=104270 RepID=UPI0007ED0E30|nr:hypothetical protein [Tenacibaculum ovolyticum]